MTKTTHQILLEQIGIKLNNLEYLDKIKQAHYQQEAFVEATRIENSPNGAKGRLFHEIFHVCKLGMIPEVFLRELDGGIHFKATDKTYHDLENNVGEYIECKRWNQKNIDFNIDKFLNNDAVNYNTSRWLAVFTFDEENTWLERVVEIKREELLALSATEEHVVRKAGSSYTIDHNTYLKLKQNDTPIVFVDGLGTGFGKAHEVRRPFKWFEKRRRESKSGYVNGGWDIFDSQL